jgi:CheY-like chemotaxis protein
MKGDQDKALAAGCDDYITKPIDTRALPETIARHLAKRSVVS